jgi:hypothetical protein
MTTSLLSGVVTLKMAGVDQGSDGDSFARAREERGQASEREGWAEGFGSTELLRWF